MSRPRRRQPLLHRTGRWAFRHPGRVLLAWLFVLLTVVGLLATQPRSISSGITVSGTPSQRVLDDVAGELPNAGGTQGSLVFVADDGGRVDTPERRRAIVRAVDALNDSGDVVDREAAMAEQRSDVRATITRRVEKKVAARLRPRLSDLATQLDGLAEALSEVEAMAEVEGLADVEGMADRARRLVDARPARMIDGASRLLGELADLRAAAEAMGGGPLGAGLPDAPADLEDPRASTDEAVDRAFAEVKPRLDALLHGPRPPGTPLVHGDRTLRTVQVSDDGTVAMASLQLTRQLSDLPSGRLDHLLLMADVVAKDAGMAVAPSASLQPEKPPVGGHEAIGLGIALVVLLLALSSVAASVMPVVTALAGVFIGVGTAFAFSDHYQMTTSTPALGLMVGLAVGIDYALFVLNRQRHLITHDHRDAEEATALAIGSAGRAVAFAGTTVITALLGLTTLGIAFVTTMALTAAATTLLAVLISLTALPALMGLAGDRVVSSRARRRRVAREGSGRDHGPAGRWVGLVTARPWATVLVVVAALGVLAVPAADLRLGMPSGGVADRGAGERVSYDAITRAFGEGVNAPLVMTLRPAGGQAEQEDLEGWLDDVAAVPGVENARLMGATDSRDLLVLEVTPQGGPTDDTTQDLVERLRATELAGVGSTGVTGLTALNLDLTEVLADATPVYLGLVVSVSLVILLLVFRSVLVPVVATAGFLLSIAATFGIVVSVFGDERLLWLVGVDRASPILSFLPIMATGILYGLAMDYQVFLGTSIREAHGRGQDARTAIHTGFAEASRVVLAAAVIMVSVFGGFVLAEDSTIRQFGLALSAGILIDAFAVRMTLMPALLAITGEKAWWLPRWVDRWLPRVDLEGAAVEPTDDDADAPTAAPTAAAGSSPPATPVA